MQESRAQGIDSQQETGADQHEGDWAANVLKTTPGVLLSASEQICCYVFEEIMLIVEDAFCECARVVWGGGKNE